MKLCLVLLLFTGVEKSGFLQLFNIPNTAEGAETQVKEGKESDDSGIVVTLYVGCWTIQPEFYRRYPNKFLIVETGMTVLICINHCWERKMHYAVLHKGNQCSCIKAIVHMLQPDKHLECGMSCPGDMKYKCGGSNHFGIFSTGYVPVPKFTHISQEDVIKRMCGMCMAKIKKCSAQVSTYSKGQECCCLKDKLYTRIRTTESCNINCYEPDVKQSFPCGDGRNSSGFASAYTTGVTPHKLDVKIKPVNPPVWIKAPIPDNFVDIIEAKLKSEVMTSSNPEPRAKTLLQEVEERKFQEEYTAKIIIRCIIGFFSIFFFIVLICLLRK